MRLTRQCENPENQTSDALLSAFSLPFTASSFSPSLSSSSFSPILPLLLNSRPLFISFSYFLLPTGCHAAGLSISDPATVATRVVKFYYWCLIPLLFMHFIFFFSQLLVHPPPLWFSLSPSLCLFYTRHILPHPPPPPPSLICHSSPSSSPSMSFTSAFNLFSLSLT